MKKKLFLSFLFLVIMVVPKNVFAASNPYNTKQNVNGVITIPCTYVAWQQAYERMGVALPSFGNAINWYSKAASAGYSVGKEAKANSILVFSGSYGYGHVAYVTSINGNVMNTIEGGYMESKWTEENGYERDENGNLKYYPYKGTGLCDDCKRNIDSTLNNSEFIGFIYLDNAPKNPPSSNTNTKTVQKVEKKSNNSYLKSLNLSVGSIEFNKDTLNYSVNVQNDVDKITISGEVEDAKSSVKGLGDYDLKVGENKISIVVTAEDGSTKSYELTIIRNKLEIKNQTIIIKTFNKNKTFNWIFIPFFIILMIISVVIIVISRRNSKKK